MGSPVVPDVKTRSSGSPGSAGEGPARPGAATISVGATVRRAAAGNPPEVITAATPRAAAACAVLSPAVSTAAAPSQAAAKYETATSFQLIDEASTAT